MNERDPAFFEIDFLIEGALRWCLVRVPDSNQCPYPAESLSNMRGSLMHKNSRVEANTVSPDREVSMKIPSVDIRTMNLHPLSLNSKNSTLSLIPDPSRPRNKIGEAASTGIIAATKRGNMTTGGDGAGVEVRAPGHHG